MHSKRFYSSARKSLWLSVCMRVRVCVCVLLCAYVCWCEYECTCVCTMGSSLTHSAFLLSFTVLQFTVCILLRLLLLLIVVVVVAVASSSCRFATYIFELEFKFEFRTDAFHVACFGQRSATYRVSIRGTKSHAHNYAHTDGHAHYNCNACCGSACI